MYFLLLQATAVYCSTNQCAGWRPGVVAAFFKTRTTRPGRRCSVINSLVNPSRSPDFNQWDFVERVAPTSVHSHFAW
jgi:hypothetical protein